MDISKFHRKTSLTRLICLLFAVLAGILFFGLRPNDFNFSNNVHWIAGQAGIRFDKYGIAYTDPIEVFEKKKGPGSNGFSIEMALKPSRDQDGFSLILVLHSGNDENQLVVGQWRSWIIVMNGDDYDHRRRVKRIAVDSASQPAAGRLLTITSGPQGTKIYVDGQIQRTKEDLTLAIPGGGNTRLVLGNSVYGGSSWKGDVYGLAFYAYPLTPQDAALHFNRWQPGRDFVFSRQDDPIVLYLFNEKTGSQALDHSDAGRHLNIPSRMQVLDTRILSFSRNWLRFDAGSVRDIIINFIGFIPLGFVLMATFVKAGSAFRQHGLLIAVGLCFAVSLTIEIIQAWIPSRSSDFLDLVLNTLGGLSGVLAYYTAIGKAHGTRQKKS